MTYQELHDEVLAFLYQHGIDLNGAEHGGDNRLLNALIVPDAPREHRHALMVLAYSRYALQPCRNVQRLYMALSTVSKAAGYNLGSIVMTLEADHETPAYEFDLADSQPRGLYANLYNSVDELLSMSVLRFKQRAA